MVEPDPLYTTGDLYERWLGEIDRDLGFWPALAERLGARRVLELGCGSGRLLVPLARALSARGGVVVGLDREPRMLHAADRRLAGEPESVRAAGRLVLGDMRRPKLGAERFDLVFVPFNTLAHVHSQADRLACLRSAASLLAQHGRLAVDVAQPDLNLLGQAGSGEAWIERTWDEADPGSDASTRVLLWRKDRYERASQTFEVTLMAERMRAGELPRTESVRVPLHVFFPAEMDTVLALAGLEVEARYGDYEFGAFDEASTVLITVARPIAARG